MTRLMDLIIAAETAKPKFGEDCNSCGWCCMTEVCAVGKINGGGEMLPCKFLTTDNKCSLAQSEDAWADAIGSGVGCCSETQAEKFAKLGL